MLRRRSLAKSDVSEEHERDKNLRARNNVSSNKEPNQRRASSAS
jgi:hypothetical protein